MALAGQGSPGREDRALQARGLRARAGRIRAACRAALTACALAAATPALALSCSPWDHLHAWAEVSKSDRLYLVVKGELSYDAAQLPDIDWDRPEDTPGLTLIEGFFAGEQLGRNGFRRPWAEPVTVAIGCVASWCGGFSPGPMIAFIEMREGDYLLGSGPCGGMGFPATAEVERDLIRCARGGRCRPRDF